MSILPASVSGKSFVTPTSPEGIFVRSGAGAQFTPVASAFIGDSLELVDPAAAFSSIGVSGEWIQVQTAKGDKGWVNARFVQRAVVEAPSFGTGVNSITSPQVPAPVVQPSVAPPPQSPVIPMPSGQPPLFVHTTYARGQYIRAGVGPQFPDIASVTIADKIEALGDRAGNLSKLGKTDEWIQVRTGTGVVGWAAAWYLEVVQERMSWTVGHALAGLHGPTEAWVNRWDDAAYNMIRDARIEAVKLLASNDLLANGPGKVSEVINKLRSLGVRFTMARLFAKFEAPKSAREFVNEVAPAAQALFANGVQHFEIHNEPNLNIDNSREGMYVAWQNGQQFGQFFHDTMTLLRQEHGLSNAFFGFPGLSPIQAAEPQRTYPMAQFLTEADSAVSAADFVCMHNYWGGDGSSVQDAVEKVRAFCQRYPGKVVLVTEFANTAANVSKDVKGNHYAQYYNAIRSLPANLGAAFSYAMKSAGDYDDQTWANSSIPAIVGSRRI